jgi:hypothetical protein
MFNLCDTFLERNPGIKRDLPACKNEAGKHQPTNLQSATKPQLIIPWFQQLSILSNGIHKLTTAQNKTNTTAFRMSAVFL